MWMPAGGGDGLAWRRARKTSMRSLMIIGTEYWEGEGSNQ